MEVRHCFSMFRTNNNNNKGQFVTSNLQNFFSYVFIHSIMFLKSEKHNTVISWYLSFFPNSNLCLTVNITVCFIVIFIIINKHNMVSKLLFHACNSCTNALLPHNQYILLECCLFIL